MPKSHAKLKMFIESYEKYMENPSNLKIRELNQKDKSLNYILGLQGNSLCDICFRSFCGPREMEKHKENAHPFKWPYPKLDGCPIGCNFTNKK